MTMPFESKELKQAPTPRGAPFVGNLFEAWKDPTGLFLRSTREHGDIVLFRFGPFRYFLANHPGAAKHVLVDNHKNYVKSRSYRGLKLLLGQGLLTSEGDFWRRQRKLAQPAFHRERLAGFARTMVDATDAMLGRWSRVAAGEAFDVHAEMMRLTFRIVGQTLFSTDVESDADAVGPALNVAIHFANDYAESLAPIPVWLPTPHNLQFKRAVRTLDTLVQRIILARRAQGVGGETGDLLSMLMSVEDEETGERMSDRQLRDEVMTLVLAGHETTANALSWTFYLLSRHPDVERRLFAEISQVLEGRPPSLDDLPKLTLCANVVQEAMRLYPPAWTFERQALEDDELAGCTVPAGAIVAISPFTLHRHPAYWDNPEGFDPDRFTPARSEGRPKHAYLPFGGGPRLCIGNSFALMEAQLIVASVVQRQRLSLVPGHPVELEPVVTLRPRYGIQVRLAPQRPAGAAQDIAAGPARAARASGGAAVCPMG
jgi:cytochrome P450